MNKFQKFGYMAIGAVLALIIITTIPVLAARIERQLTVIYNDIKIYVDGERITPRNALGREVEPFISDGITYLPVRAVAEAFGKTVEWDGATQSVFVGPRPGSVQYMTDILPAYLYSDPFNYVEFSAIKSGGAERFGLGGVTYTNGFTFIGNNTWAVWNLNNQYETLGGVLCRIDGDYGGVADGTVLQVFSDGVLKAEWPLTANMAPRDISIDLRGVNQLKMELKGWNGGTFGIGNPVLE